MKQYKNRVVVICDRCKNPADWTPPDDANPYGVWHWHQPCRHCGAEEWVSHDPERDIRTGRLLQETSEGKL